MASIGKAGGQSISYGYDPGGNRITKTSTTSSGSTISHYVRDAQGNVLAVYQYKANTLGALTEGDWAEQHLYGSSRLGMLMPHVVILPSPKLNGDYDGTNDHTEDAGNRLFELTNHLGNTLATISDKLIPLPIAGSTVASYNADIVSAQDYYPFGMQMPGRTYLASGSLNYRYGFNGKENDNEVKGVGDQIDYGMRVYDPRIGKFLSVDPLTKNYPWYTPYQFAGNKPIWAIDMDGLEEWETNDGSGTTAHGPYTMAYAASQGLSIKAQDSKPFKIPFVQGQGDGEFQWHEPWEKKPRECLNCNELSGPENINGKNVSVEIAGIQFKETGIGEAKGLSSAIPGYGNGRNSINAYQNHQYILGTYYAIAVFSDAFLIKSASEALAKGGSSLLKLGTSTTSEYRTTFFTAHPEINPGETIVHHAVEQQVLKRYPGLFTESEIHSLENLRGIPKDINANVYLSRMRIQWDEFYINTPNATKTDILKQATIMDNVYGSYFTPTINP